MSQLLSPPDAATADASDGSQLPALAERHDAFTGEQMARFCEVLAETGTVTTAARVVDVSRDTAYTHRRRNPLFAAAWTAALSHARHRLADRLLERAIEGSIDYLYRDGVLVGERHHMDNRLAYAMLRRLDQQAEQEPAPVATELARQSAERVATKGDYRQALTALRTGSEEDLCAALAIFAPPDGQPDKPDNPPLAAPDTDGFDDSPFGSDRVWEEHPGEWWTSFAPPPGFDGEERGRWDADDYARECTEDESGLLTAAREAQLAGCWAEEQAEREAFWTGLRAELTGAETGSATEKGQAPERIG